MSHRSIVFAALLLLACAPVVRDAQAAPGRGADAQAIRRALALHPLHTLDGKPVALDGGVVVVNFWATWCKPCRHELPILDRLHRELLADGGRVIAVSLDLEGENVRRFVKANRLGLPVCLDGPDGLAKQLALGEVPYTIVLDRKGEVAYTLAGTSDRQLAELSAVARRLAGEQRTALSEAAR
jgi:thiol-disulfide isomerase/thioredoxin